MKSCGPSNCNVCVLPRLPTERTGVVVGATGVVGSSSARTHLMEVASAKNEPRTTVTRFRGRRQAISNSLSYFDRTKESCAAIEHDDKPLVFGRLLSAREPEKQLVEAVAKPTNAGGARVAADGICRGTIVAGFELLFTVFYKKSRDRSK